MKNVATSITDKLSVFTLSVSFIYIWGTIAGTFLGGGEGRRGGGSNGSTISIKSNAPTNIAIYMYLSTYSKC